MAQPQKPTQFPPQSNPSAQQKGYTPFPRSADVPRGPQAHFPQSASRPLGFNVPPKSPTMSLSVGGNQGNQAAEWNPGPVQSGNRAMGMSGNPRAMQISHPQQSVVTDPPRLNPIVNPGGSPLSLDSGMAQSRKNPMEEGQSPQDCPLSLKLRNDPVLPGLSPIAWNAQRGEKQRQNPRNVPEEELKVTDQMRNMSSLRSVTVDTKDSSTPSVGESVQEGAPGFVARQTNITEDQATNIDPKYDPISVEGWKQEQSSLPGGKRGLLSRAKHLGTWNMGTTGPEPPQKLENQSFKSDSTHSESDRTLDGGPNAPIQVVDLTVSVSREDRGNAHFTASQPRVQQDSKPVPLPFKPPAQGNQKNGPTAFEPFKPGTLQESKFGPVAAFQLPGKIGQKFGPAAVPIPFKAQVQGGQKVGIAGAFQHGTQEGQKAVPVVSEVLKLGNQQPSKFGFGQLKQNSDQSFAESRNPTPLQGPFSFSSPNSTRPKDYVERTSGQTVQQKPVNPFQNSLIQCTASLHQVPTDQIYRSKLCTSICQNCVFCLDSYLKASRRNCPKCAREITDSEAKAIEAMVAQFPR